MAKFVVAGCSDCPYFAKVEILADNLKINVPNFEVHKIVKTRKEWATYALELNKSNHWHVKESPIIWRELVDRGGKGHLIGGANEFQEYARCYYNVISDFTSKQMQDIALDNIRFKNDEDRENREFKALSTPMKVCIAGAIDEAVPHFVLSLAKGDVIDKETELSIVFLDKANNVPPLKSLQMGTFDLAYPLVRSISITDDAEAAFADSALVVIFDEMSEYEPDLLMQWMKATQEYYEYLGNVIEKYCPTDVKVLLVPTNAVNFITINLVSMHHMLQRIPKFNVVGLSRPIEQQVRSVIAKKLSVNPSNVHNIIVWGNVGSKMLFDLNNSRVHQYDGSVVGPEPFSLSVDRTIWDKKWLKNEMEAIILKRFDDISELRASSGNPLALATAVSTFLHQWINGDDKGYIHSLVVASEGWYDVPAGMVFSMPVTLNPKGYWTVVQDIELSEIQFKKIKECIMDINEKVKILYPWMNNNNNFAEMVTDENFYDSQINALLQEVYSKGEINAIRSLINNLTLDDRIEISKSKDLLISTVDELRKPPKIKENTIVELPKSQSPNLTDPIVVDSNDNNTSETIDNNMDNTEKSSVETNEVTNLLISDSSKDDMEKDV